MNLSVINFRQGPFGTALAFFDIVIEDAFIVRGFALKRSAAGKLYYQAPSKKRTDKQGNAVKDDNGYDIYDAYFELYGSKDTEGKYSPTEAAWEGRKAILTEAEALLGGDSTKKTSRGAAPKKKATVTSTTSDASEDDEDSDMPF